MSDREQVDELHVLVPGHDVTLSTGRVVRVEPMTFAQGMSANALPGTEAFVADLASAEDVDSMPVYRVASRHPEWMSAFIAHVTSLTAAEVNGLSYSDGVRVAMGAVNENLSFFGYALAFR